MKTFEDFLHEENKKHEDSHSVGTLFCTSEIDKIMVAYNKYKIYEKQDEWKTKIYSLIEDNTIEEWVFEPNYINKSKYNDSFHPPKDYESGVSLLTIAFKNKIE